MCGSGPKSRWPRRSIGWRPPPVIYAIQDEVITDLVAGEEITHDGFEGWEPIRVIGSVGEDLILVVTQEVPDEPERVAVGVSRFNPFTSETHLGTAGRGRIRHPHLSVGVT